MKKAKYDQGVNYPYTRSSKRIVYFPDTDTFAINNEIDDSWQEDFPASKLGNETLIVDAIEKKAFFKN